MRIAFLSDTHLTVVRNRPWPDGKHRARLRSFLDRVVRREKRIDRVVLLGDIFDTWRVPPDRLPPDYEEIFQRHRGLLDRMADLAAAGRLVYVIGNHDFDVPRRQVGERLPGVTVIGPGAGRADCFRIRECKLFAAHGHQYSLFNNLSRPADLLEGYPIGYYISRLRVGQSDRGGRFSFGQLLAYVREIADVVERRRGVFEALIDLLRGKYRRLRLSKDRSVSISDVRSFARRLGRRYPAVRTVLAAAAEETLAPAADHLCLTRGARLVVFGHTHRALIDGTTGFPPRHRRTYANTGCWCSGLSHFVVADTKRRTLELNAFPD